MSPVISKLIHCRKRRLVAAAALLLDLESAKKRRSANKHRRRLDWFKHCESIDARLFKRAYRLTPAAFDSLLEKIRPKLEKNEARAKASSGSRIEPETRLAMALRYLAGGSYLDICFTHGVNQTYFYAIVWEVLEAIHGTIVIKFPVKDLEQLKAIAAKFGERTDGVFYGCVGALDGLCIRIRKPTAEEAGGNPMDYYNRKGFWQAVCDSNYEFTMVSLKATGKTHDSQAFEMSDLGKDLDDDKLPAPFWIAGDDAYSCAHNLLTPYPGRGLGKRKDVFNHYQSNCRIKIEQAFGILVARWGILWRPLTCSLDRALLIVHCCAKLHNICCQERIQMGAPMNARDFGAGRTRGDSRSTDYNPLSSRIAPRTADDAIFNDEVHDILKDRHRSREVSALRNTLADALRDNGFQRPRYSNYSAE